MEISWPVYNLQYTDNLQISTNISTLLHIVIYGYCKDLLEQIQNLLCLDV